MKNLLLFFLIAFSSYSQVDTDNYIVAKYVEFLVWDKVEQVYVNEDDGSWVDIKITPFDDYYLFEVDNDGEIEKVWWEYDSVVTDDEDNKYGDAYYTRDGRKIVFDYEDQQINFFSDYSEKNERYMDIMIVSKIESYTKED